MIDKLKNRIYLMILLNEFNKKKLSFAFIVLAIQASKIKSLIFK